MFKTRNFTEYIPETFLCAGVEESNRDACQDDSGGPVGVANENG